VRPTNTHTAALKCIYNVIYIYRLPLFINYSFVLNIFLVLLIQQEKACKQEDRLIAKLQELDMDTNLVGVLRRQAIVLLDGGPTSGLGLGVHRDSIPMHTFARFLFVALLDYYPDLAYEVGLRAMRWVYTHIIHGYKYL